MNLGSNTCKFSIAGKLQLRAASLKIDDTVQIIFMIIYFLWCWCGLLFKTAHIIISYLISFKECSSKTAVLCIIISSYQQLLLNCVYCFFFSFLPFQVHQWMTLSESVLFFVPDITCWYWYSVLLFVYLQPPSGHRRNPVGQAEAAASGQSILCAVFRHWAGFRHSTLCWEGDISHQGGVYYIYFQPYLFLPFKFSKCTIHHSARLL